MEKSMASNADNNHMDNDNKMVCIDNNHNVDIYYMDNIVCMGNYSMNNYVFSYVHVLRIF